MEPLDLTGVKEYASEIAQPLRDRLVEDICRRVKEAGAITTTAEYEIYRAEQLGLAEKEIKAAIAEQSGINAGAVDMLFGDILDRTVRFWRITASCSSWPQPTSGSRPKARTGC